MIDAMRSMARFSWAMSLFGMRQTTELLTNLATARSPRKVAESFDAVAEAAAGQLAGGFRESHRDGDRWQERLIDTTFRAVDPAMDFSREVVSQTLVRGSLLAFRQTAQILAAAIPRPMGTSWQEVRNKLEAFEHFQFVDQILGVREMFPPYATDASVEPSTLKEKLAEAERAGSFLMLWLTEGLGFAFAEAAWNAGEPRGLLRNPALDDLPAGSMIPLHTGMGLAMARRVLSDLDSASPSADIPAVLERFEGLCRSNARDGYALASYEALGLIVRQLSPEASGDIDRALASTEDGARHRGAFWHGLGRGLYFVASQAIPGSTGRAVDKIRREAAAGVPRANALSGLAWAVTLVNLRQPAVLESFLNAQSFSDDEGAAIAGGISSALLLWVEFAGEESHFKAFMEYRPQIGTGHWQQWVLEPCRQAVESWSEMKRGAGPGEIFHFPPAVERP